MRRLLLSVLALSLLIAALAGRPATVEARPRADISTALVVHFPLDESSGPRGSSCGSSYLAPGGSPTQVSGKLNYAVELNGTDYLAAPDSPTLSIGDGVSFSIGGWIKLNSTAQYSIIASKDSEYSLGYANDIGHFAFWIWDSGGHRTYVESTLSPSIGVWYYVLGSYDAGTNTMYIWVNAANEASGGVSGDVWDGTAEFWVGRGFDAFYSDAAIDDVILWKRALTSGERTDLYNGGSGQVITDCPTTPVWKIGNYLIDGDLEAHPWPGINTSSVIPMFGTPNPLPLCGSNYTTLYALPVALPPPLASTDTYGGLMSQSFQWRGGDMYISIGILTTSGSSVSVTLINPTGQFIAVISGMANQTNQWRMYSTIYQNAELGEYSFIISQAPNGYLGKANIDCVSVNEADFQPYYYNTEPIDPPTPSDGGLIERTANNLTVAAQEEILKPRILLLAENFAFIPLETTPWYPRPAMYLDAPAGEGGAWGKLLSLPTRDASPAWTNPASPPGGLRDIVYGNPPPPAAVDSPVGQAVSSFWVEGHGTGLTPGTTVTGMMGSVDTTFVVPETTQLGVSFAVQFPDTVAQGEAAYQAQNLFSLLDTETSTVLTESNPVFGNFEVAPLSDGTYVIKEAMTLANSRYRFVFDNKTPYDVIMSHFCVSPYASIDADCLTWTPFTTEDWGGISATLSAMNTQYAQTAGPQMTATATARTATAQAQIALTQTALATGGNATQIAAATRTQLYGTTATAAYNLTSTAFSGGFHATLTAIVAGTQTAVATQYMQNTAFAQTRAAQTAQAGTAAAATHAAATLQASAVPGATTTSIQQTQTAMAATLAPAYMTATALSYIQTQQAQSWWTQTAVAGMGYQLTLNAQYATLSAMQTQIAQGTAGPDANATATALAQAQATQNYFNTQIASIQQTQAAQGSATAQATAMVQPPPQPAPAWDANCLRPDNPFNLAWWTDYEPCRIMSWFSWSPTNTQTLTDWQTDAGGREPFTTITQFGDFFRQIGALIGSVDWHTTAFCSTLPPNTGSFFQQAKDLLLGDIKFNTTSLGPISDQGNIAIEVIVGPFIARGIYYVMNFLCIIGLYQWLQWIINAFIVMAFVGYLRKSWLDKLIT